MWGMPSRVRLRAPIGDSAGRAFAFLNRISIQGRSPDANISAVASMLAPGSAAQFGAARVRVASSSYILSWRLWIVKCLPLRPERLDPGGPWHSGTRQSSSQLLSCEEEMSADHRIHHDPRFKRQRDWQRGRRTRLFERPSFHRLFARPSRSASRDTRPEVAAGSHDRLGGGELYRLLGPCHAGRSTEDRIRAQDHTAIEGVARSTSVFA